MIPRHYVLTRAVYHPRLWSPAANRRRLELFRGITAAGLAAQTRDDWVWVLALSPDDPLRAERLTAARAAGVEVRAVAVPDTGGPRSAVAIAAYRADWAAVIDDPAERLTTRIDDDDTFAPDAFARLRGYVSGQDPGGHRRALILPVGFRVWAGRYTRVRHESNAWATLWVPAGDLSHVYGHLHRKVRDHARVTFVDYRPAWLWPRHADTLSGWRKAARPVTPALRRLFPIDWDLLDVAELGEARPGGERFP